MFWMKKNASGSRRLLSSINTYATRKGDLKIYLLIDEYDNFTNTILSTYGTDLYRKATHGEGYIRRFFNVIKAATTEWALPSTAYSSRSKPGDNG